MSDFNPNTRFIPQRLAGLVIATGLGWMLFGWMQSARCSYWLLIDPQQGMATIVKEHWGGHGRVVYNYVVNEKRYAGASIRDWREKHSSKVKPGEQAIVYFSASHPWISRLYPPDHFLQGWPILLVVFPLEIVALITLIKPASNWAFNIGDKNEDSRLQRL